MAHLYEFVMPVRQQTLTEFVAAHPVPFLLLARRDTDRAPGWSFKTQTVSIATVSVARFAEEQDLQLSPELSCYEVFPLAKMAHNPWAERISVGRARNNDIVLADSSVSKLHAHFRVSKDIIITVTDAGSRNNTWVNERELTPGEPVEVHVGDTLTFGRTALVLIDAAGIFELISRLVHERSDKKDE